MPRFPHRQSPHSGFTLIELIIVIVLISILSVVAVMKSTSVSDLTARSQADKLAADLRHAQSLAASWGRNLQLKVTMAGENGTYQVLCTPGTYSTYTTSDFPCQGSAPVIDPATGQSFQTTLQKGVSLNDPGEIHFDTFGRPSATRTYSLSSTNSKVYVGVTATTGLAVVCTTSTCP